MRCDDEIELLTRYVRGVVMGPRAKLDAIDEKAVASLRREPLHAWLLRLAEARCKLRGTRGNSVREVLHLLEQMMNQIGVTKQELARRSGVSRQRLTELFGPIESRPLLETIVRIAVGLDFPLEIIAEDEEDLDDGPATETTPPPGSSEGVRGEPDLHNAGVVGAAVVGSSLVPVVTRKCGAYVGVGLAGAGVVGLGFVFKRRSLRHAAFFIGAGICAGALAAGLTQAGQAQRARKGAPDAG